MDSQNDFQQKMMEMAAENGALTPEVMQEMLRQQTAQKAVDVGRTGGVNSSAKVCSCGTVLQPTWKACPNCGSPIV